MVIDSAVLLAVDIKLIAEIVTAF